MTPRRSSNESAEIIVPDEDSKISHQCLGRDPNDVSGIYSNEGTIPLSNSHALGKQKTPGNKIQMMFNNGHTPSGATPMVGHKRNITYQGKVNDGSLTKGQPRAMSPSSETRAEGVNRQASIMSPTEATGLASKTRRAIPRREDYKGGDFGTIAEEVNPRQTPQKDRLSDTKKLDSTKKLHDS